MVAIDASPTAVNHITERCASEGLAVTARQADLRRYEITQEYDVIVSIGLLMFFEPESARRQLAEVQNHVRTGGIAVVNVLIEGTTYMDMFDPAGHYLFQRDELREAFASWKILSEQFDDYKAPTNSVKRFVTIIARK